MIVYQSHPASFQTLHRLMSEDNARESRTLREGIEKGPYHERLQMDIEREMKLRMTKRIETVRTLVFENLFGFVTLNVQIVNEQHWQCQVGNMLISGDSVTEKAILSTILDSISDDLAMASKVIEKLLIS